MGLLLSDLDSLLRQRVDDQDLVNPLFPEANRFRAINKSARKVASLIDRTDEGYRTKHKFYTSAENQAEYPFPDDFERCKQVEDMQEPNSTTPSLGRVPPRMYVPWVHRFKYERASVLEIVPTTRRRGSFYSYRADFLLLIPTPNQDSTFPNDVRLWYLPAIKEGTDANSEIDLPKFTTNLLVALAALELLGPTGDDLQSHAADAAFETEVVQERVTPRTDDGPMRISDDRGDTSFSLGF